MKAAIGLLASLVLVPGSPTRAGAYEEIFQQAGRYTVKIKRTIRHAFAGDRIGTGFGAGFLVDRERGLIVTNAHVSGRSPASISVGFRDTKGVRARPVYIDPELDLAILKVPPGRLPSWSSAARMDCGPARLVGRQVATFGHPRGLAFSATTGIVSRVGYVWGSEQIQTDLPTNPGNSGGALIDLASGRVIGVVAARVRKSQGISLAVPSRHLCKILSLVRDGGNPSPPDLGLEFAVNRQRGLRLYVVGGRNPDVLDKLRIGDRIVAANGQRLRHPTDLSTALRGISGDVVFEVKRGGTVVGVTVPVRPRPRVIDRKGLMVDGALFSEDVFAQRKASENLLYVHSVVRGSRAESQGIRPFYRLFMLNSSRIGSLDDLRRHLEGGAKAGRIVFRKRGSARNTIHEHVVIRLKAAKTSWIAFPKLDRTKVTGLRPSAVGVEMQ